MNNIDTVKKIYEAFGKGDVPAILELFAEDIVWEYGTVSSGVPWLEPRKGRAGAGEFFAALGGLDITKFEVNDVVGGGSVVVALINIAFTVKATGKGVTETDESHIWRFDQRGRVKSFRHATDTLAHANAAK